MTSKTTSKKPTILQSIIPIVILLSLVMSNVLIAPDDTLSGANQLSLLLASTVAVIIALFNRVDWKSIIQSIISSISTSLSAILILMMVGIVSGAWMISGVIPSMIYYGLDILRYEYFLPATVVITAIVSLSTGSSWSTVATVGVALISVGSALGFNEAITAGAIISGAYFGDKVSPLSDTTNLAASVSETDIFTHIRYLMQTTIPSIVLAIIGFIIITFSVDSRALELESVSILKNTIADSYHINIFLLLIPILTIFMIMKKIDALPALMTSSLIAVVIAAIFQQDFISSLIGKELDLKSTYQVLTHSLYGQTIPNTGNSSVDALLTTGGMAGMINTIWLIITGMVFGGALEAGGFIERISEAVVSRVKSSKGLVTATTASCILSNMTSSDQYISIIVPGKMFLKVYKRMGLENRLLGRTLEDGATATSVLVPWNTCGATQATMLGVSTIAYLPFAFFCWLSPLMTLLFVWLGIGIKVDKSTKK